MKILSMNNTQNKANQTNFGEGYIKIGARILSGECLGYTSKYTENLASGQKQHVLQIIGDKVHVKENHSVANLPFATLEALNSFAEKLAEAWHKVRTKNGFDKFENVDLTPHYTELD